MLDGLLWGALLGRCPRSPSLIRHIIERMFGKLKENRRIVIRFDKLAKAMPLWSHALFGTSLFVKSLDTCDWLLLAASCLS
jgi:hypothetical protein